MPPEPRAEISLCFVVGARPNFVKAAPVIRACSESGAFRCSLIHTGQHYDRSLSDAFFNDLELPEPDLHLEAGSGSHAAQTGQIMQRLEPLLETDRTDCLVVFGDVNSTLAAALTAAKLGVPIAHVEAGLRSFDSTMPEEINRRVTDCLSALLFTTEESANQNLEREGVAPARVHYVGNTMVDSLLRHLEPARARRPQLADRIPITRQTYGVLTLHRPANVDDQATLTGLWRALEALSARLPIVFPVHPRTRRQLVDSGLAAATSDDRLVCCDPLPYLEFLALMDGARLVLTDSGGIQEETTVLGVPCLTLRSNTERPVTVSRGTNRLVGSDPAVMLPAAITAVERPLPEKPPPPPLWDGRAATRIASVLVDRLRR